MAIKITAWDDALATKNIMKRYRDASDHRRDFETRWAANEQAVYRTGNYDFNNLGAVALEGVDQSPADSNNVYIFKNIRFLHAQMSANPPSVVFRPSTSDQEDHRRADAADRAARWGIRHYQMQECFDNLTLSTLVYGSGVIKSVWDSTKGAIIEFDEETGEVKLEGDCSFTTPFIWNIFLDPDAKSWTDVKWVIERIYVDYDEACVRWPDKKDELEAAKVNSDGQTGSLFSTGGSKSSLSNTKYNTVELLEYWETGLPSNGYLGRYCITTSSGKIIEPCRPSPFRFHAAGAARRIMSEDLPEDIIEEKLKKLPQQARLPYHLLTDIDVPNNPYGRSPVEYVSVLQDNVLKIDTATMDNIYAHGAARLVINDTAEIDQSLSNSPWDIIKVSGNQSPYFMEVPQLMPEMVTTRMNHIQGINDGMGVNDAMFGVQKRETSGTSMNYATNQGNMIRRRLFNKYVLVVESVYNALISLIVKHWSVARTISVLGKENASEAVDLKGSDIDGGYDIIGEYGVSLSLDPMSRREEIMLLQPLFEKSGVPARTSLKLMKLNELEGMYDRLALAENRQREVFDEMIATGRYIAPEDFMDHENMVSWALEYFMTQEFQALSSELRQLCKQHIRDRVVLAAQEKAAFMGGGGQAAAMPGQALPPGPTPQVGPMPAPEPGVPAQMPEMQNL